MCDLLAADETDNEEPKQPRYIFPHTLTTPSLCLQPSNIMTLIGSQGIVQGAPLKVITDHSGYMQIFSEYLKTMLRAQ